MFVAFRIFIDDTGHGRTIGSVQSRLSGSCPDICDSVFPVQPDVSFFAIYSRYSVFPVDGDCVFSVFSFDRDAVVAVDSDFAFISLDGDAVFPVDAYAGYTVFPVDADNSVFAVSSRFPDNDFVCRQFFVQHDVDDRVAAGVLADLGLNVLAGVFAVCFCPFALDLHGASQFVQNGCSAVGSEVQPFAFDRLVGDVGDVLVQLVFVYAVLYAVSVCHGGQVFPVPFEFYCRCRVFGQCDGFLASAVCRYSELGLDIGYRVVRRVVDVVDQLVLVNPVCDFLVAQVDGHCVIGCRKFYCRRGRFSQFYLAGCRSRFQVEACFQVADVCLVVLDGIVVGDCVVQLVFVQSQAQPVVVDCRLDVFIAFDCQRRGRVDGLCPFRGVRILDHPVYVPAHVVDRVFQVADGRRALLLVFACVRQRCTVQRALHVADR